MADHLEALTKGPSTEFWANTHVKCPHCGVNHDPYAQEWFYLYQEDRHEVECPSFERSFGVTTRATFDFSTDDQDDLSPATALAPQ